jgi:hypothetical protein
MYKFIILHIKINKILKKIVFLKRGSKSFEILQTYC